MATLQAATEQRITENVSVPPHHSQKLNKIKQTPAELLIQNNAAHLPSPAGTESSRWLTVSPYPEAEHLLDLSTLDTPNRLLALALVELDPATEHYATIRYEEALDWSTLMLALKSLANQEGHRWKRHEFYVVEFRSKLKKAIDTDLLFRLDKESHIEATASGGLLKYWYGVPDANRRNLATCLWRNKEDAIEGGRGPWHKQARAAIPGMYEEINVKGLRLVIEDDVESWSFEPYS